MLLISSLSFLTVLFEVLLTRIFSIVLFGPQVDLAVSLAILGIGVGCTFAYYFPTRRKDDILLQCLPGVVAISMALLIAIILELPLTTPSVVPPETFQDRSHLLYDIVNTPLVALMVALLLIPFSLAGYGIAYVLNEANERAGIFYGYDLLAGAVGSALGYAMLNVVATPDAVFLCLVVGCIVSIILVSREMMVEQSTVLRSILLLFAVGVVTGGACLIMSKTDNGILRVKYASGYSEQTIVYSDWSPLSRVAINRSAKTNVESIVLDNASASTIVKSEEDARGIRKYPSRAFAYRLVKPCGRAAIIGASAGPEVAMAHWYSCKSIDAIDIVGKNFEVMRNRYPTGYNPYLFPEVNTIGLDGRTAITVAPEKYDVIQMVHANLWSAAGVISNVWSHSYLETEEAFLIYLSKISDNGIISFSRGIETNRLLQAALGGIKRQRPADYWRHAMTLTGQGDVLLLRPRPWTQEEVARVQELLSSGEYGRSQIAFNPLGPEPAPDFLTREASMTDDRPFSYSPSVWSNYFKWFFRKDSIFNYISHESAPVAFVYSIMVVQFGVILILGSLLLGIPCFVKNHLVRAPLRTRIPYLLFAFFVGYGFMAIELVVLNKAVLYLGNPTFATALGVGVFLVFAGLGSLVYSRSNTTVRALLVPVGAILVLSPLTFLAMNAMPVVAPYPSLVVRGFLTAILVAPLAFFMGQPFSQLMRIANLRIEGVTPWLFAVNTWSSVLAGFGTTIVAQTYGYSYAGCLGLSCYVGCSLIFYWMAKGKGQTER